MPRVSVITTLQFPREHPLECLLSWTAGQDLSTEDTELIVISNRSRPRLEKEVLTILREQDRFVTLETDNEMELYDTAAREAKGEWLLFIEPHCTAESHTIRALLETVERESLDGACVRTLPSQDTSRVEQMEARMYLQDAETWTREDDWRKFTKRGTMLRRSAFEAIGGFDYAYLRFSEITIASKFHQQGYRIGFAPEATIHHQNSPNLGELLGYVWEYRRQEVRVLQLEPQLMGIDSSSASPHPIPYDALVGEGWLKRALWTSIVHPYPGLARRPKSFADLRQMVRNGLGVLSHLIFPGFHRLAAAAQSSLLFVIAWLRFSTTKNEETAYQSYLQIWQHFGDVSLALMSSVEAPAVRSTDLDLPMYLTMDALPLGCAAGFHGLEKYERTSFRWTQPVACLRLCPEAPARELKLNFLPVRTISQREVRVYWQGRLLERNKEKSTANSLTFLVPQSEAQHGTLILSASPMLHRESSDHRLLGLPLVSVQLT